MQCTLDGAHRPVSVCEPHPVWGLQTHSMGHIDVSYQPCLWAHRHTRCAQHRWCTSMCPTHNVPHRVWATSKCPIDVSHTRWGTLHVGPIACVMHPSHTRWDAVAQTYKWDCEMYNPLSAHNLRICKLSIFLWPNGMQLDMPTSEITERITCTPHSMGLTVAQTYKWDCEMYRQSDNLRIHHYWVVTTQFSLGHWDAGNVLQMKLHYAHCTSAPWRQPVYSIFSWPLD